MTGKNQRRAGAPRVVPLLLLSIYILGLVGCGSKEDERVSESSLASVAAELQRNVQLDYKPLEATGTTLPDVAEKADVVGIGQIVDVRPAYSLRYFGGDPDDVQHMLIVIKPDRLVVGEGELGKSGLVFLDQTAPARNIQTDDSATDPIDDIRRAALASPERVGFLLSVEPEPSEQKRIDEAAGREADDPLLWPTVPSSVLAVNEQRQIAFPLLTSERIENSSANLSLMRELGVDVAEYVLAGDAEPVETGGAP